MEDGKGGRKGEREGERVRGERGGRARGEGGERERGEGGREEGREREGRGRTHVLAQFFYEVFGHTR